MTDSLDHPQPAGSFTSFPLYSAPLDPEAVLARLTTAFTEESVGRGLPTKTGEPTIVVTLHGVRIVVALADSPVPEQEATRNCHPAYWTDTTAVDTHVAHAVVRADVVDRPDDSALERTLAAHVTGSLVAASLVEAPEAVALYTASAATTLPPEVVSDIIRAAYADPDDPQLPVDMWLSVWSWGNEVTGTTLATFGLPTFGHADLMLEATPLDLADSTNLLLDIARYVVTTGAHLHPGDELGHAERRIRLEAAISPSHGEPVLGVLL
ncbi:MAG TPA: DUF4261 domain-containing protein [Propionibacteriaceae bacterium]|nr:DUF4261 domain-containing protein [Propionibacteriaceae bacterium]